MSPKFNDLHLHKKNERKIFETKRRHMKIQAEMQVMMPQSKDCQGTAETGRSKKESSFRRLEGVWPCLQLDLNFYSPEQ